MQVTYESLLADLEALQQPKDRSEREVEAKHLVSLLEDSFVKERLTNYREPLVVGVGGSGLILKAQHCVSGVHHAIKLPRLPLYNEAIAKGDSAEVDPELTALAKISHQNITRLYDSFLIPNTSLHCVITQYVPDNQSLDDYAYGLCCGSACRASKRLLRGSLRTLSEVIYAIVEAIDYMHSTARLLHFDLKPDNILVTPDNTPFVTDLGFAREIREYSVDETVWVGFTWKYAHSRLTQPHDGARVSRVAEKSKIPLNGRELSPKFDVFAFGRTLQQVLQRLNMEYGEQIHSQYVFNYLHLVACMCLDGLNSRASDKEDFISDLAMGLPKDLFVRNRFADFSQIKSCLGRLTGRRRLEDALPEVDRWLGSTINASDVGPTTLTSRLESVINHPALQRLKREKQLGMLDNVFPTANHTRFQHTLGTYHAVTQYITALYYDPDNPVFRVLFDEIQCATALIAALCHDLGQTAYGHELEEVDKEEFDHEELVEQIITSPAFATTSGHSLKDLIEGHDDDSWGLSSSVVLGLLAGRNVDRYSLGGILRDMLDSQIDADKFDYLIRDSVESRVSYGHGIDHERFLRSLTTHVDSNGFLRLAIKQKGAASAEAFIYARYQLYQSLYWHHAFRATKAMLLEAVRLILEELWAADQQADLFSDKGILRDEYARHVIGIEPKARSKAGKATRRGPGGAREVISQRVKLGAGVQLRAPYDTDLTMKFLWSVADKKAKRLVNDLVERRYYKRIFEVSPSGLTDTRWERLKADFRDIRSRKEIQEKLQQELYNVVRGALQSRSEVVVSLHEDRVIERFEKLAAEKSLFILDMPLRGWYAADDAPVYVSDYKRRHFRASAGGTGGVERREEFWIKTMGNLMRDIAFIRVFCEPEVHALLTRVISGAEISKAIYSAVPDLREER